MKRRSIPYNPNCPASADVFVGRTELLKMAIAGLPIGGICYSLVGPAGMGKTSLLNAVSRYLRQRSQKEIAPGSVPLPIYVECLRSHQTLPQVLQTIVHQTIKALKLQHNLHCPAPVLETVQARANQNQNLEAIFKSLLDWAFEQQKQTLLPVLLLDDLHRLCQTDCLAELTSLLQTAINQQQLSLILAGRDALTEELRNDVSPLKFLITHHYELKPLPPTAIQKLVAKAANLGWAVEPECSHQLHQLTQGHPYRLHYYLYGALTSQESLTVKGLTALHTPETQRHLDRILSHATSDSRGTPVGLGEEWRTKIRLWICENELETALKSLLALEHYQQAAAILSLQLKCLEEEDRKGTTTSTEIAAGRTRIADGILKLIQ